MSTSKTGICINTENCTLARQEKPIRLRSGQIEPCPECGVAVCVFEKKSIGAFKPARLAAYATALCAVFFVAIWVISSPPAAATRSANAVAQKSDKMLRFAGSNTIGSELMPALAEAYMKQHGITEVKRIQGASSDEVTLIDAKNPSPNTTIDIASHGSTTAFIELSKYSADIGMASRKIKLGEVKTVTSLGDMTSPANEHILALDGVAVIVNRNNAIRSLAKEQIAAIFAGVITDWVELGGRPGKITLYARDHKSGTFDTFQSLVLENLKLSEEARRFEDSTLLSERVAQDESGIGFVGLPFVKNARALAVSERGTTPLLPNRLTIGTEDYPLARRLYLYTPTARENPHIRKFTDFVLSRAGQEIVKQYGFVEQNLLLTKTNSLPDAPIEYTQLTSGAQRLTLNFRFLPGSHKLDNKAVRDIDRVIEFVENAKAADKPIMLFGFSDALGDDSINLKLSQDRAKAVADELTRRGVKLAHVIGYGAKLPVASNNSKEGRERNRRVEIWVKN